MMSDFDVNDVLESLFDEYILLDIRKKVGILHSANLNEISKHLIAYVDKHYKVYDNYIDSKISNFYGKHKKFTRFILISITIFYPKNNILSEIERFSFNKSGKLDIEHIVPQKQDYNKLNSKNAKLKNRIGNLALLSKDTNVKISNKSFFEKCKVLTEDEKKWKVNECFGMKKVNFSKDDIRNREKEINKYIFEIFFENHGELLKAKLGDYLKHFTDVN